jgi:hypothetical protein
MTSSSSSSSWRWQTHNCRWRQRTVAASAQLRLLAGGAQPRWRFSRPRQSSPGSRDSDSRATMELTRSRGRAGLALAAELTDGGRRRTGRHVVAAARVEVSSRGQRVVMTGAQARVRRKIWRLLVCARVSNIRSHIAKKFWKQGLAPYIAYMCWISNIYLKPHQGPINWPN